ncbi:nephrin isoform X1 [Anastrepha obliqua]|uniref:nephrin isoform X1 n=1 Tax=Anastrepha obliqua TaxID=95512 RepID=UPI0024099132|nr:nephrin isoform X1 [Anastrepha obliqua]
MNVPQLFLLCLSTILPIVYGNKDVPSYQIEAISGETIHLPCNATTNSGDEVILILWYREGKGTPIYSVDIRAGISKTAKRWSDETAFGDRAHFILANEPWQLTIRNSQVSDTGVYRCRVDFDRAQTYNSQIALTVIALPKEIIISDENGTKRSTVVGPYNEGDFLILKCEAIGGNPRPELVWFYEGVQLKSEMSLDVDKKSLQSVIKFGPLKREHLNGRLSCQAGIHQKTAAIEAIVQIDMNFPPLNIRLLGARQPLSAGLRYDLLCQSAGGRPPAVITWWQNEIRLEKTTETTSSDGNQTTSTLSVTFEKSDAGKYLSCKAYNLAITTTPLEDGWILDIQYTPEAEIRLGTSLNQNTIKEGADVYFDCVVKAHPPAYRVDWRHNGHHLPTNISQGVIISNHSLALQGVNKASGGNFSCIGYNTEGEGQSPPFTLDILYAPICVSNQTKIYGVAKHENVNIKCTVDANPPTVNFNWAFNNSVESIDVAANHILKAGLTSSVEYTPITELDYGTLLCSATNSIGIQRTPCMFHIIAAGRPDQVHNCSFINMSVSSLTIACTEGFNGGLPQLFILEVMNMHTKELYLNITSTYPRFTISALIPTHPYVLAVYAFNSKGRSEATILKSDVLKITEKRLNAWKVQNHQTEFVFPPLMSLTVGLTITMCIAVLAVILSLRTTCRNSRHMIKECSHEHNRWDATSRSSGIKDMDTNESDERNPDVIPELIASRKQESSENMYFNSINQTSLPWHLKNQVWSGYNSLAIGMNHKQCSVSMQQFLNGTPQSIPVSPQSSSKTFSIINSSSIVPEMPAFGKQYEFQTRGQASRRYKNNYLRRGEQICTPCDEISAQTPLMLKRGSTI